MHLILNQIEKAIVGEPSPIVVALVRETHRKEPAAPRLDDIPVRGASTPRHVGPLRSGTSLDQRLHRMSRKQSVSFIPRLVCQRPRCLKNT